MYLFVFYGGEGSCDYMVMPMVTCTLEEEYIDIGLSAD